MIIRAIRWSILMTSIFVSAKACREETLVAIEDNHEGVSLTIFPTKEKEQNGEASDQLVFKNHHLSHECGPNLERCQDPLVEYYINSTDKSKHSIIFIPLDGGLALVDVARSDYPLGGTVIQHFIFLTNGEPVEISCSPSAVFKIIDGFYVVCTNWTTNFVSIFEIYLNKTSLKSTQFSFPLNELTVPASLGNITNATNFIHIEYLSYHYIVFALGTAFYSLRPFFYAENRLGDVQSKYCDAVHLLVQKEGVEFWAYCSDYVYSYDVGEGDWNTRYALAERGITYQCSQARVKVSVFSDHANIGRGGSDDSVNMRGSDFVNGVCFGNGSRDFFAYVDELAGVYVMDVETTEMRAIYELGCNDRCLPPIVVNSSYLIIRGVGERKVSVLDFFRNPPELLEAVNTLPVLVSMLFLPCPPETIPVLAPPIDVEGMDPSKLSKPRVIGGVVGSVMFILVVVSVVVAAVVGVLRWRKWKNKQPPLPEKKYNADATDPVMAPIDKFNQTKIAQETQAPNKDIPTKDSPTIVQTSLSVSTFQMQQTPEPPSDECSLRGDQDYEETSLLN